MPPPPAYHDLLLRKDLHPVMSGLLDKSVSYAAGRLRELAPRDISSTILNGADPTKVDPSHPITLFIIQLLIIIAFTQSLGWAFRYIKQPAVIAEVIGGIILGPTVMGRIPGFTQHIFPQPSITYLNLVANLGLILFLFLIGLEVDVGVMKRNGKAAALVSVAGMVLPFGLGAACAVPTYHTFVDTGRVSFGHFLLFVGVAMAITAFPVLCRILSSTKLLDTRVGVIVLAAGVGNDVVGWVLLALTLALVNAGSGVTAVYMLLLAVGWTILMLWPIKIGFRWLARRTGSLDHGPTPAMMTVTLVIVFISAFFTGIIGVHPIFGAFIAGLIIPHEGGFAIALVEKIDDLVAMLFLPIYFVLSGLSTNLGLLDSGISWGYIIMFCVVGWFGKFAGCAAAAKYLGYTTRESGAIGMLMSCKGLVEIIVLNVGYNAGIIDQRLFSMFVVVAVVLTFITTPFTLWIYPERHRVRGTSSPNVSRRKDKEGHAAGLHNLSGAPGGREQTDRILVVLQKIEHLSAVMFITQMLEPVYKARSPPVASDKALIKATAEKHLPGDGDVSEMSVKSSPSRNSTSLPALEHDKSQGLRIDALKLIELTGRTFSVMQSAEKDQLLLTDDALQLFKQFGRLRGFEITPHIDIVGAESYPQAIAERVVHLDSELILLPWTIPVVGQSNMLIDPSPQAAIREGLLISPSTSPFESIFGVDSHGSPMYTHFVRRVFAVCPADIALFVDRGFGSASNFTPGAGQHIFMPFFGGPDDRLALRFVVQLCQHEGVSATVVRIEKDGEGFFAESGGAGAAKHQAALQSNQLTLHPSVRFHMLPLLLFPLILSPPSIPPPIVPPHIIPVPRPTVTVLSFPFVPLFLVPRPTVPCPIVPFLSIPLLSLPVLSSPVLSSPVLSLTQQQSPQISNNLVSETADGIAWEYYTSHDSNQSAGTSTALGRIAFHSLKSSSPLTSTLNNAEVTATTTSGHNLWRPLLIVTGRGRRAGAMNHENELNRLLSEKGRDPTVGAELRKTVGDVATSLILGGGKGSAASFLVLESGAGKAVMT